MKVRAIKKYRNRRLYDPGTGCYITLEEVRNYIHNGYTVQVFTHPEGFDVTQHTLQALLPPLPVEDLHRLISGTFALKLIPLQEGDGSHADIDTTDIGSDLHRG